ncbi:hypothetical protein Tco_1069906 [Tanacetum coccineum]|uniref:Uncharacterized protein n=1 Tax=Tanacetum coccineum TaxID=301880 RepID=A0ABQ5HKZ4_9ASTR
MLDLVCSPLPLEFCEYKIPVNTLDIGEFPSDGSLVGLQHLYESGFLPDTQIFSNDDWMTAEQFSLNRCLVNSRSCFVVQSFLKHWWQTMHVQESIRGSSARSGDFRKCSMNFKAKGRPFRGIFSMYTLDGMVKSLVLGMNNGSQLGLSEVGRLWCSVRIVPCPLSPRFQLPPPEVEFEVLI